MDQNAKRLFLFMLVALPILMVYQMHMARVQRREQERRRLEAARIAAEAESAEPSVVASPTTSTLAAAPSESVAAPRPAVRPPAPPAEEEKGEEIVVETEVYRIRFTTAGAYPVSWEIIDPGFARAAQSDVDAARKAGRRGLKVGEPMPIQIIPPYQGIDARRDYPLMVVLKETGGRFFGRLNRRLYRVERAQEADGTQVLTFTLPPDQEGVGLKKVYRFPPRSYLTDLQVVVENGGGTTGQTLAFSEIQQPGLALSWGPGIGQARFQDRWDAQAYRVAVWDGDRILDVNLKDWEKAQSGEAVERSFSGALKWGAVESRFYMATVVPRGEPSPLVRALVKHQHVPAEKAARAGMALPASLEVYSGPFQLRPGESRILDYTVFVGPKKRTLLADIDKTHHFGLRHVMFHTSSWLIRTLAVFMLQLLVLFHQWTGNYGIAIILVTLVMRLITQPFTHIGMKHQAHMMAEQKRIKPLIDAINEKYKNDPQKRNAEVWKTYKEHGVNPLGMFKGCIWILVQLPIFFALYRLLAEAVDLRGEGFLWIRDLTAPDALFLLPFSLPLIGEKFNLIPILMGVSQVFAQRLQSSHIEDPTQKQMAVMMPIVFVFILYNFASGLSLYWFVSNLWQIIFQIVVNKRVKEEAERKVQRKFEQRAAAPRPLPGAQSRKPEGWREKVVAYHEARAKEAEKKRK